MATVITDDKYYKDIAQAIREGDPSLSQMRPAMMPLGVKRATQTAKNEGKSIGYTEGKTDGVAEGRQAESEERNAQEAQYLADINAKITVYGASEAETLSDVPQAVGDVYGKGKSDGEQTESEKRDQQDAQYLNNINTELVACGVAEAEALSDVPQSVLAVGSEMHRKGYSGGYNDGYEIGKQSERDRFWDAFQDYGNRTDYAYAFRRWNIDYLRPKYKIQNITLRADTFFQYSKMKKIEAAYFDLTGINGLPSNSSRGATYGMFDACIQLEEIEDLNIPAGAYYATWHNCVSLKKIAVVRCAAGKAFTMAFVNCNALEDVTFTGTMSMNGLDLQYSPKLNRASIESLIDVLSASTSGLTVTLSKAAVNAAFETSEGANDGSASDEWATKILEKSKWTISLI